MPIKKRTEPIRVIASVVKENLKYLVCQRPRHKRHGGLWEFPGGKIREGESNFDAAKRELREELSIDVIGVGKLLFNSLDPGSPYSIEFISVDINGIPKAIEHSEVRWLKAFELSNLSFAPADEKFVKEYLLKENQ